MPQKWSSERGWVDELAPIFADTCQSWQWNRCGNQCGPRTGVLSSHRL